MSYFSVKREARLAASRFVLHECTCIFPVREPGVFMRELNHASGGALARQPDAPLSPAASGSFVNRRLTVSGKIKVYPGYVIARLSGVVNESAPIPKKDKTSANST